MNIKNKYMEKNEIYINIISYLFYIRDKKLIF